MRQPTSTAEAYAWHRAALAGDEPATDDTPQCGWFKRKMVRGGPWVPARIWLFSEIDDATGELVTDEILQAEVGGRFADPEDLWPWVCGNPISEQDYRFLEATADWSRRNAPDEPMATPHQAIDWLRVPTPTF
jgi:hypothetical protein